MTFVIVIFLFSLIVRRGLNWMVMKIKLGTGQKKKKSENLTQLWL